MPVDLTDSDFEEKINSSRMPVFVDFWAAWCFPCRSMEPLVDEFAEEVKGRVEVFKVNVDENYETAKKYRVSNVPTYAVFVCGEEKGRGAGAKTKNNLKEFLKQAGVSID